MKNFHGKTAYITGGSSGIGFEVAKLLVKKGADVLLFARQIDKLEAAGKELSSFKKDPSQTIDFLPLDVADHVDVENKIQKALQEHKKPDLVIASAGKVKADYFENISYAEFDQIMKINVYGIRNVIFSLLPALKKTKGHIVMLSSAAGLFGMYSYSAYATSKFAVIGLGECLRSELHPYEISVTVVCPPEVKTPMINEEAKTIPPEAKKVKLMAGSLTPDYVARTVIQGIRKKSFMVIPGWSAKFLYFFHRLSSGKISRLTSDYIIQTALRKNGIK
jgi:3-dehydrosphinganine reductase